MVKVTLDKDISVCCVCVCVRGFAVVTLGSTKNFVNINSYCNMASQWEKNKEKYILEKN